jgi:hypothetical protein
MEKSYAAELFFENCILLHYAHNSKNGKKPLGKLFVNLKKDIFKMSKMKFSKKFPKKKFTA